MAKFSASEIAMDVIHQAINIYDEMGFGKELQWSALFDAKFADFTKANVSFSGS